MYTIVIPTDFSATANKALEIGEYIAKRTNATVYLVHYYGMLLNNYTNPETAIPMDMMDQIRIAAEEQMKNLLAVTPQVGFELITIAELGHVKEDILDLSKKLNADLIIMGTTGSSSLINKLIGSNASHVMEEATIPVMLVPKDCEFNSLENAVFSDDYKVDNSTVVGQLIDFSVNVGLKKIDILYVNQDGKVDGLENDEAVKRLRNVIGENRIMVDVVTAMNFEKGIDEYQKDHHPDLIIMSTEKKSLLQRLFVFGHTQIMAMHTHVPLLVYHR